MKAWTDKAVDEIARELASTPQTRRNNTLNRCAFRFGRFSARGWLARRDAEQVLETSAIQCGLHKDSEGIPGIRATIRSGFEAGLLKPHPGLQDRPLAPPGKAKPNGAAKTNGHAYEEAPPVQQAPPVRLKKTSAAFVANFVPPDYLIDGLLQRRFLYSVTGQTGAGKTALFLLIAYCIARGITLNGREIERGRVLYLAGENPDDVRMRWMAMAEHIGFDPALMDVDFIDDSRDLDAIEISVRSDQDPYALVLVDTSAAFFPGSDENDNVQMGNYARRLRQLVTLRGGPTVLVACHPVKNAAADNLLPRGGGAFLNEVDGNLILSQVEMASKLSWQGKFRGPDFEDMNFELSSVTAETLRDSKGRLISTVIARSMTEAEHQTKTAEARHDEDAMLVALFKSEAPTNPSRLAEILGWQLTSGAVNKRRGGRVAKRLEKEKLVKLKRGLMALTSEGEQIAKTVQVNAGLAGSTYG